MSKPTVLFVDDEPSLLRAYARLFSREFEVLLATDGDEALHLLETRPEISLILCDIFMPKHTGLDLLRMVEERRPEMASQFVFVTGGVPRESLWKMLTSLPNRILIKPIDPGEVRALAA